MNVLFHVTSAIGIIAVSIDTQQYSEKSSWKSIGLLSFIGGVIGIISHGALDYIPHCYPIASKADASIGMVVLLGATFLARNIYKLPVFCIIAGSVFPDVIDLGPAILKKYLSLHQIPDFAKVFPWHVHRYSGSIFEEPCGPSFFNHTTIIVLTLLFIYLKRKDVKEIFPFTTTFS